MQRIAKYIIFAKGTVVHVTIQCKKGFEDALIISDITQVIPLQSVANV